MAKQEVIDVGGWVHDSLQGDPITTTSELPKRLQLEPDSVPVAVDSMPVGLEDHSSSHRLYSLGENHGRSYELNSSARMRTMGRIAVWHDEFSNPYTSHSLKGNNFSKAEVMRNLTAPSGYTAYGLLESNSLVRVVRSSHALREAGVSTEWINRVFEPKELLFDGELVSQREYKKRLINTVYKDKGIEKATRIAGVLQSLTFFVTSRSMEINDRPLDLLTDTKPQAQKRLAYIFRVYNELHQQDEDFQPLSIDKGADIARYATYVLPSLLGKNMARLHNAGLAHHFPVLGNVHALGGMIDLDSVTGERLDLDDEPVGVEAMLYDMYRLVQDDKDSVEGLFMFSTLLDTLAPDHREKAVTDTLDAFGAAYDANFSYPLKKSAAKNYKIGRDMVTYGKKWIHADLHDAIGDAMDTELQTLLDRAHQGYVEATLSSLTDRFLQVKIIPTIDADRLDRETIDEKLFSHLRAYTRKHDVLKWKNSLAEEGVRQYMEHYPKIKDILSKFTTNHDIQQAIIQSYVTAMISTYNLRLGVAQEGLEERDMVDLSIEKYFARFAEILDPYDRLGMYETGIPVLDDKMHSADAGPHVVYETYRLDYMSGTALPELLAQANAAAYTINIQPFSAAKPKYIDQGNGKQECVYDFLDSQPRIRALTSDKNYGLLGDEYGAAIDMRLLVSDKNDDDDDDQPRDFLAFVQEPEKPGGKKTLTVFHADPDALKAQYNIT